MKHLSHLHLRPPPEPQQRHLAAWLQEWRTATILEQSEEPPDSGTTGEQTDANAAEVPIAPYDPVDNSGEVRLLSPVIAGADQRPVYVAVLRPPSTGTVLVAPFSRFPVPALPGELLTQHSTPALRVLCLWSAREMTESLVARSWLVDALTQEELDTGLQLLDCLRRRSSLPPGLESLVGPPLVHPDDPRHDYMEEELARMETLTADAAERSRAAPFVYPERSATDLPMAAEDRDGDYSTDTPERQ